MKNVVKFILGVMICPIIVGLTVKYSDSIMEQASAPEVKDGFFAGFAITLAAVLLLYGFWYFIIKPYIDEKLKAHDKAIKELVVSLAMTNGVLYATNKITDEDKMEISRIVELAILRNGDDMKAGEVRDMLDGLLLKPKES